MSGGAPKVLLVLTPALAVAAVALGLRVGAGDAMRAAVVTGAPRSAAGTGLAWQLAVFDEDLGIREAAPHVPIDVVATAGGRSEAWHGLTDVDGVAELQLGLPADGLALDVRSSGRSLGAGAASSPPSSEPVAPASGWARFARREGPVVLDVAVLGQRAASSFPASLWVRARDATGAPLDAVSVEPEADSSFTPATPRVTTDATGWAHVTATPLGYSVPVILHATARDGRTGLWAGGLFVSPGGAGIVARDLIAPGESATLEVIVPTTRTAAYVEVDDARGRAWATAIDLQPTPGGDPRASVVVPPLAPGLYWAVVAGDPSGASHLGPGSIARPFFVAASADAAMAFGTDAEVCAAPGDVRLAARATAECLSLVSPSPTPRWVALDGFATKREAESRRRHRGMTIALGAVALAGALELILVLRAVASARARLRVAEASGDAGGARLVGRAWTVTVGVLVALLGFALLAAMLVRLS